MRSGTPTPLPSDKDMKGAQPTRSSTRPPPRPLLGQSTPPSATMLAIQNMKVADEDAPLGDITNSSTPTQPASLKTQNFESIHTQMLTLTAIANTLQKEMTALSRRSKDNATDLISLKEATKVRDEDIRRSLRELVTNFRASESGLLGPPSHNVTRPNSVLGITPSFLDHKPPNSPPFGKSISLPRIPPVHALEVNSEHDRAASPSLYSVEGAASVAMLEKIIREMVTKEGQDRLISQLSELMDKSNKESSETSKKVAELVEFIQDKSTSKALVRHKGRKSSAISELTSVDDDRRDIVRHGDRRTTSDQRHPQPQANIVSDDFLNILQKIKDSVMQGGAMTGEVKSLLRELRGEVLGMGRELGRKVEKLEGSNDRKGNSHESVSRRELEDVVQEGLADLKDQMDQVIQTRRRQSGASVLSRNTGDSQEVYDVVKHALSERGLDRSQTFPAQSAVDRESILSAVREAYENYKPEIELQQFGLERDEILQCLREGLEDYQSSRAPPETQGISREEVMGAVQEAMQDFQPPAPANEAMEIKEEVLGVVRECLENFKPVAIDRPISRGTDISRNDVLDALREGLYEFKKDGAREIEISPEDLSQAVRSGLENMSNPFGAYGEQVLNSLHEIVEGMRVEFKQYSAANGRDTEQVLDAMKDGLEDLRAEIESYVDRAQDVTGKDEIIDILKTELDSLRSNFENAIVQQDKADNLSTKSTDMMGYIKAEFEHLHDTLASQSGSNDNAREHKEEILLALSEGFAQLKSNSAERGVDDSMEERLDAMKEEFEQLKDAIVGASAANKEEVLDSMHESFSNLHERVAGLGYSGAGNSEIIETMKEEFAALRDSEKAPVLHSGGRTESQDEIIDAIRASVDGTRVQLSADQTESANEHLGVIREELESFREAIGGSLMLNTPGADKDVIIEAIKNELESHRATIDREGTSADPESLEAVRSEIEQLRESITTSLVQSGAHGGTGEILETVRNGLDDLKAQMSSQVAIPETSNNVGGEALDALTENLNNMRTDIAKMLDKPVDMTVSYEILDTLKEGLSSVRSDIERIKPGDSEVVLAGAVDRNGQRSMAGEPSPGGLKKDDLQGIEVLLAQLQIKVEAMDQNMQSIPFMGSSANPSQSSGPSATKEDLSHVEHILRDLQSSIDILARREASETRSNPAGGASKEDTDAIEVLLQNTKAKIDEEVLPGLQCVVTRDQINTVEAVVRLTNEAVDNLAGKVDGNSSAEDDIEALALMVHDASTSLKEIKERLNSRDDDEKVSKADVDLIGGMCSEIKEKLAEFPTNENTPSKANMEELSELLHELHESHNQLKESYESDIGVTAKAFDDRKSEAKAIMEQLEEVKEAIEESRESLKGRMKRSNEDVRALDEILQGIEDKIDESPTAVDDVRELKETVDREFERASATLEAIKADQETKAASILEKSDAHEAAIISELVQRFDERFESIMHRHDEHQQTADQVANTLTEKSAQQDQLLSGTRAMADDLKITIDTLGASVSAITPALEDATNKMGDDAKTVFDKVDDMYTKLDDGHTNNKAEHQLTRDDIAKSLSAMDSLREEVAAHNPRFMDAINNLVSLVEHQTKRSEESTEKSSNGLKEHFDQGLRRLPVPQIEAPTNSTPVERYDDTRLHNKLDEVLSKEQVSSYEDTRLHGKLDELLGSAAKSSQLDKLEEIQQQVNTTATEVSAFCAFQTKMLSAEQENKEKEADQAALDLSKCLNEKESIEADLSGLKEDKDSLTVDVESLKSEQKELMSQKMRLTADLSSLETALQIRREELQMMDVRADALERRIIEGVMDHSRALLMAKAPRNPVNMNLKRIPSNQSTTTNATTTPSMVNANIGMALKSRTDGRRNQQPSNPTSRRIASLSQITSNVPAGGKGLSATPRNAGGLGNLKRSQSVKTGNLRKHSWNAPAQGSLACLDKENSVLSEESDEDEEEGSEHSRTASLSGHTTSFPATPGTDRRTSLSYGTGPSEYTYGTGSYFTGSDTTESRTSFGSTVRSNVGAGTSLDDSIDEDEEENDGTRGGEDQETEASAEESQQEDQDEQQPAQIEAPAPQQAHASTKPHDNKGLVLHHPDGYDSGLGSDLPTAALSAANMEGSDYFKRAVEEA